MGKDRNKQQYLEVKMNTDDENAPKRDKQTVRSRFLACRKSVSQFISSFLQLWKIPELLLVGGIFSLGFLILIIHLLTWGRAVWEESERLVRTTAEVKERYIHSRLNGDGKILYRPEILISYKVGDKPHLMRAYDRFTLTVDQGFVYDQETVDKIIENYERGKHVFCWYSIDNPDRVFLKKEHFIWGWIFLIIPIVLISFGGVGLVCKICRWSTSEEYKANGLQRKSRYPTVPNSQVINESPGIRLAFRLPIGLFPTFQFALVLLLALIWNIMAWAIFIYLISTCTCWGDSLNAILFCLIFGGAGLMFFPWIGSLFKNTFAIGPTIVEISDHPIIPTRKHRLTLIQNGRIKARSYEISITCEEVARYTQGTDTITNRREVFRQLLFLRKNMELKTDQTLNEDFFLRLPCGAMHSLRTEHNEICWKLVIEIVVDDYSILRRECPVIILPYTIRSEIYT